MSRQAICPNPDQLQELLAGQLSPRALQEMTAHLDECSSCQQALEALAAGDLRLPTILQPLERLQPPSDSAYWPALQKLENEVVTLLHTPGSADTHSDLSLDFLGPPEEPGYLGRLGHFHVTEVIGRGGMGVVLRGFDPCLQRYVALKVLDPQLADDELAHKRFCREARAAATITHEHVVAIHQVEEDDKGLPFLVMQLVSGESLQERLDRDGKLPLREIVRIGMQTAAGLSAAHQHGLVHRDIKPANILIEHDLERVKLTDFGLARAAEDVKLTQTGFVAGTPLYMAPEQARGEALDHRTDLFSLGSVLYAMCTGKPPFQGSTPFLVLRQVTEQVPEPIQQVNPDIPDWLSEVIDRLLAKNPADRFQSAAEVAEVLARRLHHCPQLAPAVTPRRTGRQPAARRGWQVFWLLSGVAFWLCLAALTVTELTGLTHLLAPVAPPQAQVESEAVGPRPLATLNAQTGPIWATAFAPDGATLAMALDDGTVKVWDVQAERVRATLNAHNGPVWSVAFTPDGKTLATASDDGKVKLWEAGTCARSACWSTRQRCGR